MRSWGLLAGLAAILAGLVVAGGEATLADRTARANGALARDETRLCQRETLPKPGFFAGAGLTTPL